jgi:hypothetical protein
VTRGSKQAPLQDCTNIDEAVCHHEVIASAGSASEITEHLWNVYKEGAMLGRSVLAYPPPGALKRK